MNSATKVTGWLITNEMMMVLMMKWAFLMIFYPPCIYYSTDHINQRYQRYPRYGISVQMIILCTLISRFLTKPESTRVCRASPQELLVVTKSLENNERYVRMKFTNSIKWAQRGKIKDGLRKF